MTLYRRLSRVVTTPAPAPGFMGEGHTAIPVVQPGDFELTDPFIVLMDDRMELKQGAEAGGAHPHAGFETVTFVVEGELRDPNEGVLRAGDVQWMTAGSGIIHNEHIEAVGKTRVLQLWLTLPRSRRWTTPSFTNIPRDSVPVRREAGVEARVYSGSSGGYRATTRNFVPVTLVDIRLESGASFEQGLPRSYNGFVYVLDGSVVAGADETQLAAGQVGWLDRPEAGESTTATTALRLTAGERGARVLLYAGEPQREPIVVHGPFVGDTRADLMRVSKEYLAGQFPRILDLAPDGPRGDAGV